MAYKPGKFKLTNPPLALVIAQVGFADSVAADQYVVQLRTCLSNLSVPLSIHSQKTEPNVTPPNMNLTRSLVHLFVNQDRTHGLTLAPGGIAIFTSRHGGYDAFVALLREVFECVQDIGIELNSRGLGLRYVNVMEADGQYDPIDATLAGLRRKGLEQFEHFHHKYEYWCVTEKGRLHVRCVSQHGDRLPEQLSHAEAVFPTTRLKSYEDTVYHLDIFENVQFSEPFGQAAFMDQLDGMHLRIDQAFLNAVSEDALVDWGAEEVTK